MLQVNQLIGFGAGTDFPVVELLRSTTASSSTSALTTYSFTSVSIGAASATRRVIVLVHGRSGTNLRTISSATIGGVAATIDAQITSSSGGTSLAGIISATVPTGTTATVAITFSGSMFDSLIYPLALDNLISVTPVDTATASATSGASLTTGATVNVEDGGYVVAIADRAGNSTATWVGLTEYIDVYYNAGSNITAAYTQPLASQINQTFTVNFSNTAQRQALAVASYR